METPSPTSSASSPPPLTDTYARATPSTPSTPSPPPPSTPSPEARTPSNKAAPSPPPMVNATSLSSSPAPPPPVVNTTPSSSPAPSLPPVVNTTPPSSSPSPSPPPVVNTTPPSSSPPAASPGDSLLPPFNDHSPPASPPPEESALTPASLSPDDSYPPPPLRQPPLSPPPRKQDSPPPTDTSSSGPRTTEVPSTPSPPSRPPPSYFPPYGKESESHSGVKAGTALGIGVAVAIAVIFAAIVLFYLRKKKRKDVYINGYHNSSPLPSVQVSGVSTPNTKSPTAPLMQGNSCQSGYSYSPPDSGIGNSRSFFTYEELSLATNGFSFQNRLGEGGFGFVYKGFLPDGREVAVKQLKIGGAQGEREFQAEVEIISRVHHRHLVSLIGYCISENQRLLVYDYVPNDTLHHHLHGRGRPVMDWETRVKVAAGAARGLAYLHEDCHPRIIHRDIKTSNILLDNNFEAQVSDFGLAKLTADTNTHVSTRVMGTFGYLAPEYASSGKLTDKSDVFSFGVMLLEIITGRKPVDSSQPLGEESLVEWARPLMIDAIETGKFDQLPDPRLEKDYNEREMFQMIEAASACVRYNAQMRPRMGRVVRVLDGIVDSMDLNNGIRPGQTQIFNGPTSIEDMKCFHRMAFGSQEYSSDFSRTSRKSQRDL